MSAPAEAPELGLRFRLIEWKRITKGSLRGFAAIEIRPLGLRIPDIPVHSLAKLTCAAATITR